MRISVTKAEVSDVIEKLNNGVEFGNERAGWSYSKGQAFIKFEANGKMKFYGSIQDMAKAIVRSIKTGR